MLRGPGWIPNPAKVWEVHAILGATQDRVVHQWGPRRRLSGWRPQAASASPFFFLFFLLHAGRAAMHGRTRMPPMCTTAAHASHHTVRPATNDSCLGFIRHGAMQLAPAENCWLYCGGLAHVRPHTVSNNACAFHKHVVRIPHVLHGDNPKIPAAPRGKSQANPSTRQNNKHSRSTAHSIQTSHP